MKKPWNTFFLFYEQETEVQIRLNFPKSIIAKLIIIADPRIEPSHPVKCSPILC